jgi:hypothetical protein
MAASNQAQLNSIQEKVWEGRLPLEILLDPSECRTYDKCDPYLVRTIRKSSPKVCMLTCLGRYYILESRIYLFCYLNSTLSSGLHSFTPNASHTLGGFRSRAFL